MVKGYEEASSGSPKSEIIMPTNKRSKPVEIKGEPLTTLDHFWLETTRKATKESIGAIEEAAKQMIGIASLSQAIYFAAISLGDVKKALAQFAFLQQLVIIIALISPLIFWIACLIFSISVFRPEIYHTNLNSPDLARDTFSEILQYKHKQLRRAHLMLALGFLPLLVNIIISFFL